MDGLPLFASARNTDPETSQANRDAHRTKVSQRDLLLNAYLLARVAYEQTFGDWSKTDGTLTDEEAGRAVPWQGSTMYDCRVSYWKRCSELRKLGYIAPAGWTRTSSAGQEQQACEITDTGRDYITEMMQRGAKFW